ncbi:two-component system sensor kinase [Actinoplanes sp. SE50]|uniref:sensor histidine kinase n=1 Tax=unclassified Actinoplanes TaxID=2626549 RepID=UPI00023EBB4A|nr:MULTISPECIES: histidine kinase [unclassified Actinoplanes]AEV83410.1 two-component system sensor kinase [Actinoplanes sp. SE50/110]ATO81803.1 two-component system sensor kinase [Actinoplanes sp. SE50]SLL99211.1 two-component sensor histidine kinase [Actinoplanes sp. SE50/110]
MDGYQATLSPRWRRALLLVAAGLLAPALWLPAAGGPVGRATAIALAAAQIVALRRLDRAPRLATAGILVAGTALSFVIPGLGPGLAFVVLSTYAWARPAPESLWALTGTIVAVGTPAAAQGRWPLVAGWIGASLLAWSWGALGRARSARHEAERRRAVLEERGRIARELHDVLSHTVSVMVVQAAAADDVFDLNPAQARAAIRRTEAAGREALAELRTFLRTVRDGDAEPHDAPPQPSLAGVERLVSTMGTGGLTVALRREGDGEPPAGVQLCAYRIVQEALTNTVRHAGATEAGVLIRIGPAEVEVEVSDNGSATGPVTAGNGIRGMRERAVLTGGTLTAAPRPGGGFLVTARLPWQATA